jgi:hypothetical protein
MTPGGHDHFPELQFCWWLSKSTRAEGATKPESENHQYGDKESFKLRPARFVRNAH